MPATTPRIELLPGQPGPADFDADTGFNHAPVAPPKYRWRIFSLTLLVSLVAGLLFTWWRPPLYQSSAMLALSALPGQVTSEVGAAELLIDHQQRLMSHQLLAELADQLDDGQALPLLQLKSMLNASVLDGSGLIRLEAAGEQASLLAPILTNWIQLYLANTDHRTRQDDDDTLQQLSTQQAALTRMLRDKRAELDAFQQTHQIVSLERDEVRLINQMKALGGSLDQTTADKAEAQAELAAINDAMARGRWLVRPQDQSGIDAIEREIVALEQEWQEYAEIYTPEYLQLDPKMVAITNKLTLLRAGREEKRAMSQQLRREEAEQHLAAVGQKEQDLQQQLAAMQEQVRQFSNHLARYTELNQSYEQLQLQLQEVENALTQQEIRPAGISPLELLDPPFVPQRPASPDYWRDSALSLGGALVVAVLAVLLYNLLHPRQSASPLFTLRPMAEPSEQPPVREVLPGAPAPRMAYQPDGELTLEEWQQLFCVAAPPTRLAMMLLLSGVKPDELVQLCWSQWDRQRGILALSGASARQIALAPAVVQTAELVEGDGEGHCWQSPAGGLLSAETFNSMIDCAVHDAGLSAHHHISGELIYHFYLVYLVRQGARLGELSRLVGYLEPQTLTGYRRYSPPGGGRPLDEIDYCHPALTVEGTGA